jgi:hypothetical protein
MKIALSSCAAAYGRSLCRQGAGQNDIGRHNVAGVGRPKVGKIFGGFTCIAAYLAPSFSVL